MSNEHLKKIFETTWANRPLVVETNHIAKQANGAVIIRYGDTVVLTLSLIHI